MMKNALQEERCFEGELFVHRRARGMRVEKDASSASWEKPAHCYCVSVSGAFRKTEVQPEFVLIRTIQCERGGQGED